MHMIEQGIFQSSYDILKLNIIDWNRLNGTWQHPGDAIRTISSWVIGRAGYTIIEDDLHAYPERTDWPGWEHPGNHERLGRLYWNSFYAAQTGVLRFSDAPDFYGTIETQNGVQQIWGDIGKVSAQAFAMTQKKMRVNDIWVSVLDDTHQVVIESLADNLNEWEQLLVHSAENQHIQKLESLYGL